MNTDEHNAEYEEGSSCFKYNQQVSIAQTNEGRALLFRILAADN